MRPILAGLVLVAGCAPGLEPGEALPGGDTTNTLLLGPNAYSMPAANLDPEHEQDFYSGNAFFNQAWVEAPASTEARDGLGPLFLARSCSGCHFRDGKAQPPEAGASPFVGLLLRLTVPISGGFGPDPVYGGQIQDQATPDVPVEARPLLSLTPRDVAYDDGDVTTLHAPSYTVEDAAYGPFPADAQLSPRIASHLVGLGLLEAIPEARLAELEDPDDADGDGISGRRQLHGEDLGRFGWKGDAIDVEHQVAGAFSGDMGLTSRVVPHDDCTPAQAACTTESSGGDPEVSDAIFDLVVLYSRAVAVPVRRRPDDPEVLAGKRRFHDVGCADCHTPSHTTGPAALPALEDQLVWPYTDLLLHDLGPDLDDGRPLGAASGSEWRTPPLWGLGLSRDVVGHQRLLHDGRADGVAQAILWHGGEAEASRDAFRALDAADRAALVAFVEDL